MYTYDGQAQRDLREHPQAIAKILNRQLRGDTLARVADVADLPERKRGAAISEFLDTLRSLVDQWIDSGKREGDASIEEPWKRDVRWRSAEYPEPIITALTAYQKMSRQQILIGEDGRFDIFVTSQKHRDSILEARKVAIENFMGLLESPTRERLSRCDACRTYFVRARAPKKDTPIFRGTFCPHCKGKASVRRMNATRENRAKHMVELAAEWWPKWKPTHRHGKQSEWVAGKMNKGLGTHQQITGKWVTQHGSEIEAEAERRK